MNPEFRLLSIQDGTKGSYIIFHSKGDVEATSDPQNNIVNIIFNELAPQNDVVKRNVYYLTTDEVHDTIDVILNGESIPFDEVSA